MPGVGGVELAGNFGMGVRASILSPNPIQKPGI